ncbi:selenium cofactor biosynthesis protein YqeC [Salinirubrum litoreum]|uniref:Selenium cofactor biosynthesis protein YqeC n=1 Tax=Salinirubrum litoreum TaxID=1126234 RepID=A0ABD5RC53_9EURY|nr:selenium cofactor biosynthesis protein YqeC [Salinirubrum litoreum]
MHVADALDAREGTTCVVGAGGKKTTLRTLADRLDHAVVTATVRIPIFDDWVEDVVVTDDPRSVVASSLDTTDNTDSTEGDGHRTVGVVPGRDRSDRYAGYDPEVIDTLADCGRPMLVKADGARTRLLKAPAAHEPRIPTTATTVVPIVGARVVGKPLTDEWVHRVDRVADVTGLRQGEQIGPEDVARVVASDRGGLKDVPSDATVIPVVNMVDDAELAETASRIAEEIHVRADVSRVVLAEMRAADPVVAVV